jgi:hypothetical protein
MWVFAAWVGLVGGVGLLHDAPLYASGFLALGLVGLTKTVLGAGRFLSTVPKIVAREREARAAAPQRARPRPEPARPARLDRPLAVADGGGLAPTRRPSAARRADQQRAAA